MKQHLSCSKLWRQAWTLMQCKRDKTGKHNSPADTQGSKSGHCCAHCPEKLWRSMLAGEAETSSQNSNLSLVHFLSVLQITPGTGGIGSGLLLHKKICRHPHTIWLSVHVTRIEFQACNPLACLAKVNPL